MNCPYCKGFMAVVEEYLYRFVDLTPALQYRECTTCGQCAPMDETQPPYPEMRGPPQ